MILFIACGVIKMQRQFSGAAIVIGSLGQVHCCRGALACNSEHRAVSVSAVQVSSCWKVLCCCESCKAETAVECSFVIVVVGLLGFGSSRSFRYCCKGTLVHVDKCRAVSILVGDGVHVDLGQCPYWPEMAFILTA